MRLATVPVQYGNVPVCRYLVANHDSQIRGSDFFDLIMIKSQLDLNHEFFLNKSHYGTELIVRCGTVRK